MEHVLKVLAGGVVGTLAIFCFLKVRKGQAKSALSGTTPIPDPATSLGAPSTLEDMIHKAEMLDKELKGQFAIARLKTFLSLVRKNRVLAH